MKNIPALGFFALLFFCSCSSEPIGKQAQLKDIITQHAHGKVNQILVVADSSLWQGAVGDTFFYYFSGPYLMLPQPESIFDIIFLTPEQLARQTVKKEFRTILFLADMDDDESPVTLMMKRDVGEDKIQPVRNDKKYSTVVGQDKWAKNQLLFYIFGFGEDKLVENIARNFPSIAKRINDADMQVVSATAYQAGENADLMAEIKAGFGLDLKVPGDFKKARFDQKTNTVWLRRDSREINADLLIHKLPYTNKSQLTKAGIKAIRNEIGKIVTTRQPNSYMQINDVDLPLLTENITLNNRYTVQAKGIWETANDFLGGPFISELMLDPDKGVLIFIDGFVYAPGKDKRDYMQEMQFILSSAKF